MRRTLLVAVLAVALVGCSDDGSSLYDGTGETPDDTPADAGGDDDDPIDGEDTPPLDDATGGADEADASDTPPRTDDDAGAGPDDVAAADDEPDSVSFPDLIPDSSPPEVIETSPAASEADVPVPFTVTITFDEPIADNTIASQTVKLYDFDGQAVPSSLSLNDDMTAVTISPTNPDELEHAAPYEVWMDGTIIADQAGNKLAQIVTFSFYTESHPDMAAYQALAETYAPVIHAGTADGDPKAVIPTAYDADLDWLAADNVDWLKKEADELAPAVYWDVAETYTHYYVRYAYFFPWLDHPTEGFDHGNGTAGAMVTVQKAAGEVPEQPIAVTTYWRAKGEEPNNAYVTSESGIVGPSGQSYYRVDGVYAQAELFPEGRFTSYVSGGTHESCLWIDDGDTFTCKLNDALRQSMPKLTLAWAGGDVTPVTKSGGWPRTNADVEGAPEALGYALLPLQSSLWVRRDMQGSDAIWGDDFEYEAASGRPGDGQVLPSRFYDPLDDVGTAFGRPLWAWRWKESGADTANMGHGWLGVDPAYYTWKRHSSFAGDNSLVAWDEEQQMGFATDYCFNVFVGIDARGVDPLCP